jgi:signal peptidase I
MKNSESVVSTVLYIVFGIVLAFGINHSLAFALSTDMPVVAVESNSMVPTFSRGDILILQGVPAEQLKIGDIIVFSPVAGQTPIVHRIIRMNPDGTFQTKGDANMGQLPFEKSISPDQIHGKEIAIVPFLGWVKIGMSEIVVPNIMWFAIIISAYILYTEVIRSKKPGKWW